MDEHNCPNCGAIVRDCICDYCGTVFQSSTDVFVGRECVLVTMDDDDNIHVTGMRLHRMEYKEPSYFNTLEWVHYRQVNEVSMEGTIDDLFTKTQLMRRFGNALVERFGSDD